VDLGQVAHRALAAVEAAERTGESLGKAVVVDGSGGHHHQVAGQVPASEEVGDLVACGRLDGLAGAQDLAPQRVAGEQGLGQQGVNVILGDVEVHQDLFEDDVALGVDLVGPESRVGDHVAQDLDAEV